MIKGRPACHSCLMLLPVQKDSNSLAWAERKATHGLIFTSNKPQCKCEYRFLRWGLETDLFNMNKERSSAFHPHPQKALKRNPNYKTCPDCAAHYSITYLNPVGGDEIFTSICLVPINTLKHIYSECTSLKKILTRWLFWKVTLRHSASATRQHRCGF